jgi:hypothetical protein
MCASEAIKSTICETVPHNARPPRTRARRWVCLRGTHRGRLVWEAGAHTASFPQSDTQGTGKFLNSARQVQLQAAS